jgi:hypothetical protein
LHYSIGAWGLLEMLFIYLSFPETSHPGTLGIDKLPSRRRIHIKWINPLNSLWLLRSPNLFAVVSAFTMRYVVQSLDFVRDLDVCVGSNGQHHVWCVVACY